MKREKKDYIDLYTDYLISIQGKATATGLSDMLEGEVSHDQITRFLSKELFKVAIQNRIKFKYVLIDSGFSAC